MQLLEAMDLRHDPLAKTYVKDEVVSVVFAVEPGSVMSRVGPNHYGSGDAVITGSDGDCWSVSAEVFSSKYVAEPGTTAGGSGQYRNVPRTVWARQYLTDFAVRRASGDRLVGKPGDWLLQYQPDDHGIADAVRFARVYRLVGLE